MAPVVVVALMMVVVVVVVAVVEVVVVMVVVVVDIVVMVAVVVVVVVVMIVEVLTVIVLVLMVVMVTVVVVVVVVLLSSLLLPFLLPRLVIFSTKPIRAFIRTLLENRFKTQKRLKKKKKLFNWTKQDKTCYRKPGLERFVLFRPIKKHFFNLLCVLDLVSEGW